MLCKPHLEIIYFSELFFHGKEYFATNVYGFFGEIATSCSRNFVSTFCFDLHIQGVQLSDWKGVELVRGEEKGQSCRAF